VFTLWLLLPLDQRISRRVVSRDTPG